MELNLVVPVEPGAMREKGHEEISGRLWRVTGPYKHEQIKDLKFHCISYVWGPGVAEAGSFFDCKRPISDKTRPALEAAIKAAESLTRDDRKHILEKVEAFWIDALCIPQMENTLREKEARQATLERCVLDRSSLGS
jgi:Heterokaryon incompatibility protein (HET)